MEVDRCCICVPCAKSFPFGTETCSECGYPFLGSRFRLTVRR